MLKKNIFCSIQIAHTQLYFVIMKVNLGKVVCCWSSGFPNENQKNCSEMRDTKLQVNNLQKETRRRFETIVVDIP